MSTTPILGLSELAVAQANKFITHNDALNQIEGRTVRVLSATTTAEPGSPSDGDSYIIPSGATGTNWSTFAQGDIAQFYGGGWTAWTPVEGARVWVNDTDQLFVYDGAAWGALVAAAAVSMPVLEKVSDYTVTTGDGGKLIAVTDTTSARTVSLPAAATAGDGFVAAIRTDDATNTVTIDPNGSETIDGAATRTLSTAGDSVLIACDGTEWRTVASEITPIGAGTGDVSGPSSSVDNAIARFNGTTGKVIQNSGPTIDDTGNLDLKDKQIQKAEVKDYGEARATPSSTAGALTVDLEDGNVAEITLTEDTTFTFSNPPANGTAGSLTIILKQDATGGRTVTWPGSVAWPNGTAPLLSSAANAIDVLTFLTTDAGTTWYGFLAGKGLA